MRVTIYSGRSVSVSDEMSRSTSMFGLISSSPCSGLVIFWRISGMDMCSVSSSPYGPCRP